MFTWPLSNQRLIKLPSLVRCVCLSALVNIALTTQVFALSTTTSVYTYNNDGALTQVSTQVDSQAPAVQYLIWDNFTPDSQNPATGTVSAGNGHIVAYGENIENTHPDQQFIYDTQERLQQVSTPQNSVSYLYHPTWMMASSTQHSSDTLHFYYHPGNNPQISNIEQASSGAVSGRLGPLRAFSDGGSQILISPRKDVSGVYDPVQENYTPYHYAPFGAEESDASDSAYDLHKNPYQYAGEYKDTSWDGYYLRARWYKPEFHTFLSRDPESNLNRYGYTAGDPINRHDPSGRSYKKTMRPLSKFLHKTTGCNKCVAGRIFLGGLPVPIFPALSLIANPVGFYNQQIKHYGLALILGTIAFEVATDRLIPDNNYLASFGIRVLGDVIGGGANSFAAANSHNFHRFNSRAFIQGLEYTAGSMMYARIVIARGYRPFNKNLEDVMEPWHVGTNGENEYRVFRVRNTLGPLQSMGPVGDAFNVTNQHEFLLAVSNNGERFMSNVGTGGLSAIEEDHLNADSLRNFFSQRKFFTKAGYREVGYASQAEVTRVFALNPKSFVLNPSRIDERIQGLAAGYNDWAQYTRNCQGHVSELLQQINLVDRPSLF